MAGRYAGVRRPGEPAAGTLGDVLAVDVRLGVPGTALRPPVTERGATPPSGRSVRKRLCRHRLQHPSTAYAPWDRPRRYALTGSYPEP